MNTGSRRKPFTLREWVEHSKKMKRSAWAIKWCKIANKIYHDRQAGITVNGDIMINQPIAP